MSDTPAPVHPEQQTEQEEPLSGTVVPPPLGEARNVTAERAPDGSRASDLASSLEALDLTHAVTPPGGEPFEVLDDLRGLFARAFEKVVPDERVGWHLQGVLMPSPQNPQVPSLGLSLYVQMPGSVLNTVLTNLVTYAQVPGWTYEAAEQAVRTIIESLREERTGQLDVLRQQRGMNQALRGNRPAT